MIGEKQTLDWLEHRAGLRRLSSHPKPYSARALELSDHGETFAAAYGRKEIKGYVGFVDLLDSRPELRVSLRQRSASI